MRRIGTHDDAYTAQEPSIAGPLFDTGPYDKSPLGSPSSPMEEIVAKLIWKHQGRDNPISIAQLSANSDLSPRDVKGIVSDLRTEHQMPIGARRGGRNEKDDSAAGYFWIVDAEDREVAIAPYRAQILTMWNTLRRLDSIPKLRELRDKMTVEDTNR